MSVIYNATLFIFGAIVGSFLNVIATRYKGRGALFQHSFQPKRSYCPYCKKTLSWFELVPIFSFLAQKGKCRDCGHNLSLQYLWVELLSGVAFLLPSYFYNYYRFFYPSLIGGLVDYYLLMVIWTLVALAMILLTVIDWRLQIIPDQINLFLAVMGIMVSLVAYAKKGQSATNFSFIRNYAELFSGPANPLFNHLLAGAVGLLFFGFIIAVSGGKAMGGGDMKLAGALGLLLGWPDIVLSIGIAFIIGAIWGVFLLLFKKKGLKTSVPFGPFLVAGFFIHIFFGYQLVSWYSAII